MLNPVVALVRDVIENPVEPIALAAIDTAEPFQNWFWNLTSASETLVADAPTEISSGHAWKPDGTKVFNCDNHTYKIEVWEVPTPWDLSSVNPTTNLLSDEEYDCTSETSDISDVTFNPTGTVMYVSGKDVQDIIYYNLSEAWNPSTAVENVSASVNLTGVVAKPSHIEFVKEGREMHISNMSALTLHVFTLSSPWVPSTATEVPAKEGDLSGEFGGSVPSFRTFEYRDNGYLLYAAGYDNNASLKILCYDLTEAYNPATAVYSPDKTFTVATATIGDISFEETPKKLYISELGSATIHTYEGTLAASPRSPVVAFTAPPLLSYVVASYEDTITTPVVAFTAPDVTGTTEIRAQITTPAMALIAPGVGENETNSVAAPVVAFTAPAVTGTYDNGALEFAQLGSAFTVTGNTALSDVVGMTTGRVVLLNNIAEEIQAYSWNGSTFSTLGNAFSLTIGANNEVTRLADNSIMAGTDGTAMQRYDFDGTDFSAVGSAVNMGEARTSIAGSSQTRVFAAVTGAGIKCYDYSGGTWSQTGSTFSVTLAFHRHSICVLDSTANAERIVIYDDTRIEVYNFNGSTFSQVGNSYTTAPSGGNADRVVALSSSEFVFVTLDETLRYYSFDGTDITTGDTLDMKTINASINNPIAGELNGYDFVTYNQGTAQLIAMRLS